MAKSTLPTFALAATLCMPVAGGAVLSSGCGDDQAAPAQQQQQARPARRGGPRAAPQRGQPATLETYDKISEESRRQLSERDFRPDPLGDDNRNPFRSYVIRQPGERLDHGGPALIEPTEACSVKNSKATSFSVRELRLIGIVLRGTRGWAQFRDGKGVGHIVRRGDCLGKEKAIVEQIGAGYVRLEVTPEAPPGGAAPEPQRHDIALYPEELELEDEP